TTGDVVAHSITLHPAASAAAAGGGGAGNRRRGGPPHPQPGSVWRIVVLDPYEIARLGRGDTDSRRVEAVELLGEKNPRCLVPGANWFERVPDGNMRFVPFNGALSPQQLRWLRQTLEAAAEDGETVVVVCHVPLHPRATTRTTLVWNYSDVLDVL